MFPSLRQRLIIAIAVAVGAVSWLLVWNLLRAPDGSSGLSLLDRGAGHAVEATALLVAAGLPAIALGLVASATGNPLSGVFVVSAALAVLAWRGGPIDGYLRRMAAHNDLPHAYLSLIAEVLLFQVGLMVVATLMQKLRAPLRSVLGALVCEDHVGQDVEFAVPGWRSLAAGLMCAAVAGLGTWLLVRASDSGQVIWALLIAFALGGLVAQVVFPQENPMGILLAPALVAVVGYGWVPLSFYSTDQVLQAWFNLSLGIRAAERLPGLALVLPIQYASAAVAGCALGIGWAQVITGDQALVPAVRAGGSS